MLQHLPEPDGETTAGAFVAMHRGGKRDPWPAQQNRFQQGCRQSRGLVDQNHLGLRSQGQKFPNRNIPQTCTRTRCQRPGAGLVQLIGQSFAGVAEQGVHILFRWRSHNDFLPAFRQQFRGRHAQCCGLAPATVCGHNQRPAPSAQTEPDQALDQLLLIAGCSDSKAVLRQRGNGRPS